MKKGRKRMNVDAAIAQGEEVDLHCNRVLGAYLCESALTVSLNGLLNRMGNGFVTW